MRIDSKRYIFSSCLWITALAACAGGDTPGSGRGATAGTGCGSANLTQPCTCDSGEAGAQICNGTAWQACECTKVMAVSGMSGTGGTAPTPPTPGTTATPDAGAEPMVGGGSVMLDIPDGLVFDWDPKTPFPDGTCEPGFYMGLFDGFYGSPLIFQFPIPVVGDINLTLGQSVDGENFAVSDGELSGLANGLFPFSATVVGSLNCGTGKFVGELVDGTYNAFGFDYFFSGPFNADYNRRTHAFEMGIWDVEEPPPDPNAPPPVPPGGDGTWNATLQP